MSFRDRTSEFEALVERLQQRHDNTVLERRSLIQHSSQTHDRIKSKTEFSLIAAEIGRNISNTTAKLEKLTKLAKRKTLFDDKPVEISELTYIIKQDIANLNKQIAMLQTYTKDHKLGSKQATEHSSNVVVSLQSKLANTSMSFKDVLEIRTENMKSSKDRRDQFLLSTSDHPVSTNYESALFDSPSRTKAKTSSDPAIIPPEPQEDTLSLGIPMLTAQQQQEQQQALMLEQDRYIESRSSAIESIETTIAELGSIFQQLATMVAEQRETVQRIEQNTEDIESNIIGANNQLLKYYKSVSSNRWLMIKIFVTIIFFFLLFTLIM
ncbi:t-SNARE [Umbelopsis sp. PMI_123]|nr:t-SNARE [Umbelopsis sp. PMI_123]